MGICICDISALELYRAYGSNVGDLLSRPRYSKLDKPTFPEIAAVQDKLAEIGVCKKPLHILADESTRRRSNEAVVFRTHKNLPSRSIVKISDGVSVVCPELLFLELASRVKKGMKNQMLQREIALMLVGYELCGTYLLSNGTPCKEGGAISSKGFENTMRSLTDVARIYAYINRCGPLIGLSTARRVLDIVRDGSHSPMESSLAALMTAPRSFGGMGLPCGVLNCRVKTSSGCRYVDLAWPEFGVGLEYQGRTYHNISDLERDERRKNEIEGSGMTVFNVRYKDLAQHILFKRLVDDVSKRLDRRVRIRSKDFWRRHAIMRSVVLPSFERDEQLANYAHDEENQRRYDDCR